MTLTTLLPTLRESIPSPFRSDLWPAKAVAGTRDVTIAGVSLVRFVELCSTPCVSTGPAVIPLSGGVASDTTWASVIMTSVIAVSDGGVRMLTVDAALHALPHIGSELRLIGRVSHSHDHPWVILDGTGERVALDSPALPADLHVGDLLTLPCSGAVTVGDLRSHR